MILLRLFVLLESNKILHGTGGLPKLLYSKRYSMDQNLIIVWVIGLGEWKLCWSSSLGHGSTRSYPLIQAQVVPAA